MVDEHDQFIKEDDTGIYLKLKVQPRAAQNQVSGIVDGALKVRLTAPPVDGAANKACCAFIAECLGISKGQVSICHGQTGRNKTIHVKGVNVHHVLVKLGIE